MIKRYICMALVLFCTLLVADQSKFWKELDASGLMKGTQSGAHASVTLYRNGIEGWYKISSVPEYQKLFVDTLKIEQKFAKDYYIFYSAFSNVWRVPQDLYLLLKKYYKPSLPIDNFRQLRWMPVDETTPEKILKQEITKYGLLNDNEGRLKAYFLCANYFLFGNVNFPGECTFEYFTNDKSNTKVDSVIFEGILKIFNVPKEKIPGYVKVLSNLASKYLVTKPISNGKVLQTLAQICIPKKLVNKIAYDCWVQGIPYDDRIVAWVRNMAQCKFGRSPRYDDTKDVLNSIRKIFLMAEKKDPAGGHPIYLDILDGIKKGRYQVGKFLDPFMKNPAMIPNGNEHQARLLVAGAPYLGNPIYECQIFTYDTVAQNKKDAYNEALKKIVSDIVKNTPEKAPEIDQKPDMLVSGVRPRVGQKQVKTKPVQFLSQL